MVYRELKVKRERIVYRGLSEKIRPEKQNIAEIRQRIAKVEKSGNEKSTKDNCGEIVTKKEIEKSMTKKGI